MTDGTRSSTPENTACQSHFYSGEREDGTLDTRIEEFLADVESRAAPVYTSLLKGAVPGKSQARADFATFVALMYTRTPSMRRMAAEAYGRHIQILTYATALDERTFESAIKRYERERGELLDAAAKERVRKDMLDPSGYILQIPQERTYVALSAADELSPILFNMKWSVAFAQESYYITSDNPVVRIVHPKTVHPIYGDYGFNNRTAEVSFPLSPKAMLLMSRNSTAREVGALRREQVENLNRLRAAYADRYIYAHLKDKRIVRLAATFKNSRPGFTTEGFGPKRFAKIVVARRSRQNQS